MVYLDNSLVLMIGDYISNKPYIDNKEAKKTGLQAKTRGEEY